MTNNAKSTDDGDLPVIVKTTVSAADAPKSTASKIADAANRSFNAGKAATRAAASVAGQGMVNTAGVVKSAAGKTARAASELGSAAYHVVGDLNGDGKVDEEDWKIARARAGAVGAAAAREAGDLGKAVARHEIKKDAAAGAVVGALIAMPIPLVGPAFGAAAGAAVGLTRGVIGSGAIGDVVGQVASAVRRPPARKSSRRKKS